MKVKEAVFFSQVKHQLEFSDLQKETLRAPKEITQIKGKL